MTVRSVNRGVARRAVTNSLLCQVMEPGRSGCAFTVLAQDELVRIRVALDAQLEDVAARQELRIA